jgi:hypothetical protein
VRTCRILIGALLLVGTAPLAASPAAVELQIRDLSPKFLRFYEAVETAADVSEAQRWAVPPTEDGMRIARELLDEAWTRYPTALGRIRAGAAGMQPAPQKMLEDVARLLHLDRPLKVELLAYVGGFEDNAFTFAQDGEVTVALPLESDTDVRELLMTHEFTHAVHIATAQLSGGWERSIAETVVQEGLAMRVVQKLHPEAAPRDYVEHADGWLAQAQQSEAAIFAGLLPHLASMDSESVFRFTMGTGTTGLEREAYYAGWRVVGAWLDLGQTIDQIARVPSAAMPDVVAKTIEALIAEAQLR